MHLQKLFKIISIAIWFVTKVKAELPQVGSFFWTQFASLGIFITKKVGNRKKTFPEKEIECALAAVIQL